MSRRTYKVLVVAAILSRLWWHSDAWGGFVTLMMLFGLAWDIDLVLQARRERRERRTRALDPMDPKVIVRPVKRVYR